MRLQLLSVFNQLAYVLTIAVFYFFKVHLKLHQTQIDQGLIAAAIDSHKKIYSNSNSLLIICAEPALQTSLTSFSQRLKNILKLSAVDFSIQDPTQTPTSADSSLSSHASDAYEYTLTLLKSATPRVDYFPSDLLNRVTVHYNTDQGLMQNLDGEVFGYLLWIHDSIHLFYSTTVDKVYLKLYFLQRKDEGSERIRIGAEIVHQGKIIDGIKDNVKRVVGDNVEIRTVFDYDLKNIFVPLIKMQEPPIDTLNQRFRTLSDKLDEELAENVPTQALSIFVDLWGTDPTSKQSLSNQKYTVYDGSLYLPTNPTNFSADLPRAAQYLLTQVFGLAELSDEYRKIYGKEDYPMVLRIAKMLRKRRLHKQALNFLESLKYVNDNQNFVIKENVLNEILGWLDNYDSKVIKPLLTSPMDSRSHFTPEQTLRSMSKLNNLNYFDSTYLFEQYVYGLLMLIFISGFSPLFKLLKEKIILMLLCRKKRYLGKDVGALSSIDWFFERNFVASDENDYLSIDSEDEKEAKEKEEKANKDKEQREAKESEEQQKEEELDKKER